MCDQFNINVSDPSMEGYKSTIDWICDRYKTRAGDDLFRGVPINPDDPGWFRINLLFPSMPTVSLLIDETNGYLVAFRRGNGDWFKFDDHCLPDDVEGTPLGFDSNYTRLTEHLNKETTVFGLPTLTDAYHVLVSYNGDLKRLKKALVQMIIMFCEAARFKRLFQEILKTMGHGIGTTLLLPLVMWWWTTNWKTLSTFALDCKDREDRGVLADSLELLPGIIRLDVNNRDDVAGLLGIIMRKKY